MGFPFDALTDAPFGDGPTADAEALENTLGKDLFFDGDLHVAARGDYQTVEGEENYRRGIFRRLITSPGTYRLRPNYGAGLADVIKKKLAKSTVDALSSRVHEQVALDRRTQKVLSVTVTELDDPGTQGLRVRVVVQAFGRVIRPLSYRFSREG